MKLYLAYCGIFVVAALVAAAGFSEYLFYSSESLAIFVSFAVLPGFAFLLLSGGRKSGVKQRTVLSTRAVQSLFIAWVVLAVIDVASQGYVPLVALLHGDFTYTDFKPPLHGLTNAVSLCFVCAVPFATMRRTAWAVTAVVTFQLVILHRGPAFYHVLGYAIAYTAARPSVLRRHLWRYVTGVGLAIVLFGLAGSLRQGVDFIVYEAFGITEEYRWIPAGLVWVLVYVASPTANLLYNLSLSELACEPKMWSFLSTLIPGPIRNVVLGHEPTDAAYLPCEITGDLFYPGLNVSTGYIQYYMDFGVLGLIAPSLIIALACRRLGTGRSAEWDALDSVLCVLLFVNLFAPSFNQLSFVVTVMLVLGLRTKQPVDEHGSEDGMARARP